MRTSTSGKCDVAAAGMTITDVREQNLDFSDPYFDATQALLVPSGQRRHQRSTAWPASGSGSRPAPPAQEYAQENAPEGVELVTFEDLGLLLHAVKTGQVDAGINDNGVLLDFVEDNPDIAVTAEFDTGEQYGIGRANGQRARCSAGQRRPRAARADGTYDKIYRSGSAPLPAE